MGHYSQVYVREKVQERDSYIETPVALLTPLTEDQILQEPVGLQLLHAKHTAQTSKA